MDLSRLKPSVTDAEVPWVGVAVRRNPQAIGRHTGLIYRALDGGLHLADMAWHQVFRDQPYNSAWGYYCAVPHFDDPLVEESFADYCAHVAQSTAVRRPPYNLHNPDAFWFDPQGDWFCCDPDVGMTCSSFVVAVFASYGHPLVDASTSPVGLPDDVAEQIDLLCTMRQSTVAADRAQAIKIAPEIGRHPRIRPEEAAGACLVLATSRPLNHAQTAPIGVRVLQEWDARHP